MTRESDTPKRKSNRKSINGARLVKSLPWYHTTIVGLPACASPTLPITNQTSKQQQRLEQRQKSRERKVKSMRKIGIAQNNPAPSHHAKLSAQRLVVYFRIQTHSKAQWGLLDNITKLLGNLKLEIVDHRTWHPLGDSEVLVANEIHCRDFVQIQPGTSPAIAVEARQKFIKETLMSCLQTPDAQIRVDQWQPDQAYQRKSGADGSHRHRRKVQSTPVGGTLFDDNQCQGLLVLDNNESFRVRISPASLQALRAGHSGQIRIEPSVNDRLQGLIRNRET